MWYSRRLKLGKVATFWRSGAARHVVFEGPLKWGKVAKVWRSGATFPWG